MGASRDKAADIVQETYARVLARKTSQPDVDVVRAMLYTTARNILIDQYRHDSIRQHDDVEMITLAASSVSEPERQVAARQEMQQLLDIIGVLPPRCREAFVLYKFEGVSQAEIAERMGISVNMVEKHIITGMLACKKGLRKGGVDVTG